MANTFRYLNPATGQVEERPLEPGMWDRLKEAVFDTSAVDKARAAANYKPGYVEDTTDMARDATRKAK